MRLDDVSPRSVERGVAIFAGVVLCGLLVFGLYTAVFTLYIVRTERGCLRAGYPQYRVAWDYTSYCIKRVDQTDVVVPYDERGAP